MADSAGNRRRAASAWHVLASPRPPDHRSGRGERNLQTVDAIVICPARPYRHRGDEGHGRSDARSVRLNRCSPRHVRCSTGLVLPRAHHERLPRQSSGDGPTISRHSSRLRAPPPRALARLCGHPVRSRCQQHASGDDGNRSKWRIPLVTGRGQPLHGTCWRAQGRLITDQAVESATCRL